MSIEEIISQAIEERKTLQAGKDRIKEIDVLIYQLEEEQRLIKAGERWAPSWHSQVSKMIDERLSK